MIDESTDAAASPAVVPLHDDDTLLMLRRALSRSAELLDRLASQHLWPALTWQRPIA